MQKISLFKSENYGSVFPDRALKVEMSLELIAPEVFTSYLKLDASVVCPDRAFTPLMSLELTERELLTSPNRKPREADALTVPFTPARDTVTREMSLAFSKVTRISLPDCCRLALSDAPDESTTDTLPGEVMAASNWNTIT